ncbi:efflux RND transporter periplasmic adaptor subunit [Gloeobacter violaceus]|uniref:Glr3987 protein n=1 Tax=Gloeobacter violaceus (strain ATCC 29082 / PCC 7421) TaxID=251221 RepID=Q7NE93_GLOVI|nr:efflux RND transporter periplasmic adaptor subunit [Gloeobacter violaceus]BAC91928.1 glr3987 [Gloeobacter violaceus PCC 7421]
MKHTGLQFATGVLLIATLGGCGGGGESQAQQGPPPQGVPVQVATVNSATVVDSTNYVATLISRRSVTMQPRVAGQVTNIYVRAGAAVAAGTPLVQIDAREQQANVSSFEAAQRSARAELDSAEQTLRSNQADRQSRLSNLRFQKRQFDSYTQLGTEGAVSQITVDQYRDSYETAKANVDAIDSQIKAQQAQVARARSGLKQAEASLRQQQVQAQFYAIQAPFAGAVGDIPVKVGDYVGTDTRLLTVTENRPLEVNVAIPQERAVQLRKGMSIELLDNQGKVVGNGRIFFIAPNIDTGNQAVLVKALYDNPQGQLRADQTVQSRVIWNKQPGVLVPATAISRVAGQNFVFVAQAPEAGKLVARQRPVVLGDIQGNDYQVKSGLKANERIVVSGTLKLTDGAPIVAQP